MCTLQANYNVLQFVCYRIWVILAVYSVKPSAVYSVKPSNILYHVSFRRTRYSRKLPAIHENKLVFTSMLA